MRILTLREQLPGPPKLEMWHLNRLIYSGLKQLAVCKVTDVIYVKKNGRTAAAGRGNTSPQVNGFRLRESKTEIIVLEFSPVSYTNER